MERHIATDRRLVLHARRPDGTLESQRLDPPSLGTIVNRVDDGFWQKAKENAQHTDRPNAALGRSGQRRRQRR